MKLAVLITTCAIIGLCVGSFINVVIYRVPIGLSIVRPRSMCPQCATTLISLDNVPVLSWFFLRGKCRTCAATISFQYPVIESLTSVLFALLAAREGFSPALPAMLVFVGGLLALSVIDAKTLTLPKSIVYTTLLIVTTDLCVVSALQHDWMKMIVACASAATWFVVFYTINRFIPHGLGFGDVRLSFLLGFALGWWGWMYVLLAFYATGAIGLSVEILLRGLKNRRIPFGPYLGAGSVFALLVGPVLVPMAMSRI